MKKDHSPIFVLVYFAPTSIWSIRFGFQGSFDCPDPWDSHNFKL